MQLPSMSTPSFFYFPLVLQALFLNLFRVVFRLSQCVARTFYASPHSPESRLAFWNATAGNALRTLLEWTSYPQHLQMKYDSFLTTFVIPRLGPSPHMIDPSRLQSQLQDDHTPLEFSCVLESDACGKVQCYAEPLNPMDGSSTPRETWMANIQNMLVAAGVRDADLSWCRMCADTLTIDPPSVLPDSGIHIQFAMGGDLNRSGFLGKGYFWPQLRSRLTGVSTTDLISNCVERLGLAEQWKLIARYINTPAGSSTSPEFVAVDTVEASRNRLKVYSRCSATHLSGVVSAMTLGDHPALVNHPGIQHAIANVTHLWRLMFGQDAVDNDVSQISHHSIYTKGVVIYYDLTPGRAIPMPKVYIPVRHYAKNDAHVCEVMSQYYREIGFIKSGSTYQETVEKAFPHRRLDERTGIHTYVGVAAKSDTSQTSVYFSPEAFSGDH